MARAINGTSKSASSTPPSCDQDKNGGTLQQAYWPTLGSDGRGSCKVDGVSYPSETAIPRDHPCHYCICYQGQKERRINSHSVDGELRLTLVTLGSQITCYWKQCAAAPRDCAIMHFDNVCNPSLYMCSEYTNSLMLHDLYVQLKH
nr:uncharacterized protein LOC128702138 isoform X2 [Cherax quadricarinatus]